MTEETVRASEEKLLVFISSRQDEEMAQARCLAIDTVNHYPATRVWAFEDAPASSEVARERYIKNAEKADFVICLIGSSTTQPVVEEVEACFRADGKLLPFLLPAEVRDAQTRKLIGRVQQFATWRKIKDVASLPEHITAALTDEMVRGVRDPAPINHDLYLKQKQRESIAETKRLWATLGVQNDIAQALAVDQSIGHKLTVPITGLLQVIAAQGSGKTLAAHRLYQAAIRNRLENHLEPLPIFLNARNINGALKDYIDKAVADQGFVYTQRILVIMDGLDEVGRHEANRMLGQAVSYADANEDFAVVVMTRPLPGLKSVDNPIILPGCKDYEFLSIAARVAGRPVTTREIPYRVSKSRLPLFAVIVGTHLRNSKHPLGPSPSQMVSQLVGRILQESDDYPEETAEPLKKLAVACTNSGKSVSKDTIDPRASIHAHLTGSRLVVEERGNLDFALAIFREWFAARALVEEMVLPSDLDLTSDRWVVPLAIAINSEKESLGPHIMETVSSKDPGIAGLVLEEVKYNWSTEDSPEAPPEGTAIEIGRQIRHAMSNWKEGLGPLASEIGPRSKDGDIPTLAVGKAQQTLATKWYRGETQMDPVVEIPPGEIPRMPTTRGYRGEVEMGPVIEIPSEQPGRWSQYKGWHLGCNRLVEHTRVWPWTIAKEDLLSSLYWLLESYRLALNSPIGIREFAVEFAQTMSTWLLSKSRTPTASELRNWIDEWIAKANRGPRDSVELGQHSYAITDLELVRATLSELPRSGDDTISGLWPGPDKPPPMGRTSYFWFERYTERQLLERTRAIFDGALRIYTDVVKLWFPKFNKRHQMSHMLPLRLEGLLVVKGTHGRLQEGDATVLWWPTLVNDDAESGVFFELGSEQQILGGDVRERALAAKSEFLLHRSKFPYSYQVLPGNDPRPATKLAHDWLGADLRDLGWLDFWV